MENKHSKQGHVRRILATVLGRAREQRTLIGPVRSGKTSLRTFTRAQHDAAGTPYDEYGDGAGQVHFQLHPTSQPKPSAPPPSRSTEPRPLKPYELASWTCPALDCGRAASQGTHHWEDRGPFQLLSNHSLQCPEGHRWRNSTDGG